MAALLFRGRTQRGSHRAGRGGQRCGRGGRGTHPSRRGRAGRWGAAPGSAGPESSRCARWGPPRPLPRGGPAPRRAQAAAPPAGSRGGRSRVRPARPSGERELGKERLGVTLRLRSCHRPLQKTLPQYPLAEMPKDPSDHDILCPKTPAGLHSPLGSALGTRGRCPPPDVPHPRLPSTPHVSGLPRTYTCSKPFRPSCGPAGPEAGPCPPPRLQQTLPDSPLTAHPHMGAHLQHNSTPP